MLANHPYKPLVGAGLLAAVLTSGCQTIKAPLAPFATTEAVLPPKPQTPEFVPVVRYGRYTLIELVPEPAQRDLLQQVIEVSTPPTLDASVGDGLRHVLLRTGYRLCETPDATALYALPLPAAHLRLGPLPLREALLTLAGPAWDLSVNDTAREVCFQRKAAVPPASTRPAQSDPVQIGADEARAVQTKEDQP